MIETTHSRRVWLSGTHIKVCDVRFTVSRTKLEAQFSICGDWYDGIELTMTRTAEDNEWQEDIDTIDTVRAILTVAPEAFRVIGVVLDAALAEVIPTGESLASDDFDGGWAVCDECVGSGEVVATGPKATDARVAVMCARGPEGSLQGLVARELSHPRRSDED